MVLDFIKTREGIVKNNKFDINTFKNKSTVMYGPTESGKSFICNDILNSIRKDMWLLIGISGSAYQDNSFPYTKYTTRSLIYTKLDMNIIIEILKTSAFRSELYNNARNPDALYNCIPIIYKIYKQYNVQDEIHILKDTWITICSIKSKIKKAKTKDKKTKLNIIFVRMCRLLTNRCYKFLKLNNIDISKTYSLESIIPIIFCKINPNIVILFNDLGDQVASLNKKNQSIFVELFTQGRHNCITTILLTHGVTMLFAKARDNAHNNIFTRSETANQWLSTQKMDISTKKKIRSAIEEIITPDEKLPKEKRKYPKLIYSRDSGLSFLCANALGKQHIVGDKRILSILKKNENKPLSKIDFNTINI